jgi:hypothetical protein
LTLRQNVGSVSTKFIIRSQPALLTRMPIPPTSFSTRDRGRDGGMVGDVDREGGGCAAGKANAFFGTRGVEIEHGEPATSSARRSEMARPMPLPPPVTRAT